MDLAYSICMGMCTNGVKTTGLKTITERQSMEAHGRLVETFVIICCAVVLGRLVPTTVDLRIGTVTTARITTLGFGWHLLFLRDYSLSSLSSISLVICSLFLYPSSLQREALFKNILFCLNIVFVLVRKKPWFQE